MAVVLKVEIKSIGGKAVERDVKKLQTGILKTSKSAEEFGKKMKKLEASAKGLKVGIAGTSNAFRAYQTRVNSGKITTNEFVAATKKMDATIVRATKDLNTAATVQGKYSVRVSKSAKETHGFANSADNMARSVRLMEGPLGGTAARLQTFAAVVKSGRLGMVAMALGATALIAVVVKLTKVMFTAEVEIQKIQARFEAATGSAAKAKDQLSTVANISKQLGIDFKAAAQGFSLFNAAAATSNLTTEDSINIFRGVSTAVAALALSADDTQGIFRALSQMISKGTVQAEELKGQLGERLPGAFAIAARAMGVTTKALQKMLEKGEVVAEVFLPKFAKELERVFSGQAIRNAEKLPNLLNRISSEFFLLSTGMSKATGAGEAFQFITKIIADDLEALNFQMEHGISLGLELARALQDARAVGLPLAGVPEFAEPKAPFKAPAASGFAFTARQIGRIELQKDALKKLRSVVNGNRTALEKFNEEMTELDTIAKLLPDKLKHVTEAQRRLQEAFDAPGIKKAAAELKKQGDAFLKHLRFIEGLELKSVKVAEAADKKREADFIKHLRFIEKLEQQSISVRIKEAAKLEKERLKEANRVNEQLRGAFENVSNDFAAALSKGELTLTSFKDFTIVIIQEIIKEFAKLAVIQPILNALFGKKDVGGGLLSGLIGGVASFLGFDKGAALSKGNVIPFAKGGVVSKPTLFPMANGAGLMGESGPEAVMPLSRGKDGKLGVVSSGGNGGGGGVVINMDFRGVHGTKEVERAVSDGIRKAAPQLITASVTKMRDENRRGVGA